MGSAQSYISSEAALTTLVVVGAIGFGYTQIGRSSTAVRSSTESTPQSDKGKKKRTKSSVVFNGDFSDKGQPNNDKSQQLLTIPPGFPGQFEPPTSPDSHLSEVAATSSSLSKAKKPKKKKGKAAVTTDPIVREIAASSSADYSSEISNKSRTKNPKRQQQSQSSSSQTTKLPESTASIDTDGSWTRVGSVHHRHTPLSTNNTTSFEVTTSDADTGLTPQTGNSSPIAERGTEGEESSSFLLDIGSRESGENPRKTLAEKLLPKPRRTGVDDMLETPDYPTLARVMRVQPLPDEKPASGFSWGDYEDVRVTTDVGENDADGEDDGWGVVRTRRQRVDRTSASSTFTSSSHHPTQKASETKRQRQNAQRREKEKAVKAEAERQRQAALANHKREFERISMLKQYSDKSGSKSSTSGGMKAIVDERGKLVWE